MPAIPSPLRNASTLEEDLDPVTTEQKKSGKPNILLSAIILETNYHLQLTRVPILAQMTLVLRLRHYNPSLLYKMTATN